MTDELIEILQYVTLDCAKCLQDQATPSGSVYHISFLHAIRNLTKFIFVKTTSINKKIPKKEVGRWSQN